VTDENTRFMSKSPSIYQCPSIVNESKHWDALKRAGCSTIYEETASGKATFYNPFKDKKRQCGHNLSKTEKVAFNMVANYSSLCYKPRRIRL
jgi:hypothetical protein